MQAGTTVPPGWLLCNGQEVSRTTYAGLFSEIGTTWGVGNGTTTFNVPNFTGRYPRGVASSGSGDELGEAFGSDTHTHPVDPPATTSAIESQGAEVFDNPGNNPSEPDNLSVATDDHTHSVNITQFNSGNGSTLPASRAIHFRIKT
jgi:microcystin-dependent protein